ncbi:MAG: hypothetical protein K9G61_00535 [Bacteroidales bacterium]|nr:hypothetical protein [Bacteroidales bacterium]
MKKNSSIVVKDSRASTTNGDNKLFISHTDRARNKNPEDPKGVMKNWMCSGTRIKFLRICEQLNNLIVKGANSIPYCMNQEAKPLPFPMLNA